MVEFVIPNVTERKEDYSVFAILQDFKHLVGRLMVFTSFNGFHYSNERIITIIVPCVPYVRKNIDSQTQYLLLSWGNVVVWYLETSECYIDSSHLAGEKNKNFCFAQYHTCSPITNFM